MRILPGVLLLLGLLGPCAIADAASRSLPAEDVVWRATEVPGFIVYGSVSERALYDVANGLAKLRAVLSRTAGGLDVGGERPIPVYVFRKTAEFRPYAPMKGGKPLGGYFATAFGYRAIALDPSSSGGSEAVYHEFVHYIVRRNFGDVPVWFNEGIATLYETFQCANSKATVGLVPRSRLAWLDTHSPIPVKRLAAVTTEDDDYNESERAGTFYVQSWLLVHDLLFGNPARGAQLAAYLKKVNEGASPVEALDTAFEGGAAGLDAELAAYLKKGYFPYTDLAFDELHVPDSSRARTLDRAEVLDALGMLALISNPREPGFARTHFEAVLAANPSDVRAIAGLGSAAEAEGDHSGALARIDAAVAAGADDPALLMLGARALLRMEHDRPETTIEEGAAPSASVVKARSWLEKAIRTEPFQAEPLLLYGLSYLAAGGDLSKGIAAFERADAIDPLDDDMLFNLLELNVRKRDRARAEKLFATRIEGKAEPAIVKLANEALLRLDYEDARDALKAQDYDRALPLMKRVRDNTADESWRSYVADIVSRLEAAAAAKKKAPTPKR